jgi:hypothetical protein
VTSSGYSLDSDHIMSMHPSNKTDGPGKGLKAPTAFACAPGDSDAVVIVSVGPVELWETESQPPADSHGPNAQRWPCESCCAGERCPARSVCTFAAELLQGGPCGQQALMHVSAEELRSKLGLPKWNLHVRATAQPGACSLTCADLAPPAPCVCCPTGLAANPRGGKTIAGALITLLLVTVAVVAYTLSGGHL